MIDKNGTPQPIKVNSPHYRNNYDDIEWRKRGTYCIVCGMDVIESGAILNKNLYLVHDDGSVEHVNCNFN
jgi:hypothetical protein